ncbi:hypothetical protein DSY2196 [Desulfitobacterium hafniense Y51]|uniref:Uncharacterized protein n=1 Tax=Desulfitobacterium hafniense (strain Y51) TaxID=138119 RepID=Q24VF7_DESHY|nr:hypothetical protein DSY2196 [Desulfitobacterium hafniense Y51]
MPSRGRFRSCLYNGRHEEIPVCRCCIRHALPSIPFRQCFILPSMHFANCNDEWAKIYFHLTRLAIFQGIKLTDSFHDFRNVFFCESVFWVFSVFVKFNLKFCLDVI